MNPYPPIFTQRPIYVAPANPAGQALADELAQAGIQVAGLFDNLKTGENITSAKADCENNALIVVCESHFQNDICLGLLERGFSPEEIFCQQNDSFYKFKYGTALHWQQLKKKWAQRTIKLLLWLAPRRKHIYYTEQFIDTNLLLAWRTHQKSHPKEALLLGHNLKQIPRDIQNTQGIIYNQPWRIFWHLIQAKNIVLDHEFHSLAFDTVRQHRPVIQMFHGIPLKKLRGNKHYPHILDKHFVSSSEWANQHIFTHIFNAEQFHALGYPRNDAFSQPAAQRDWITAPSLVVLNKITSETGPLIVYMPTYRDNGNNDYPIDLVQIEQLCQQHHLSFILKFHPFVAQELAQSMGMPQNFEQPTLLPGYQHIYMFPSGFNIYPWLAESKLLITDYSSVLFDYLALKRPILLYQYDKEAYLENRGAFMMSMDEFKLGTVVSTFDTLKQSLTQAAQAGFPEEAWQAQTQAQLKLVTTEASQAIVQLVRETK